jgi:hypothetical protein
MLQSGMQKRMVCLYPTRDEASSTFGRLAWINLSGG